MTKKRSLSAKPTTKRDRVGSDGELPVDAARKWSANPLLDNMAKDKTTRPFRPQHAEWHFTTALYLDDAIERLENHIAHVNALHIHAMTIHFEAAKVDSDRARFWLSSGDGMMRGVEMDGTMQRWEGSRTRIDIDIKGAVGHNDLPPNALQAALFIIITAAVALLVLLVVILVSGDIPVGGLPAIGVLVVITLFVLMTRKPTAPQYRTTARAAVRADLDQLTGILIEVFNEHDVQWIEHRRS